MIKDFFKHSVIYGIGNVLTRGISFLLLPLYTRTLSTEDFGITSFLSSLSVFLLPIISLEITQAIGIYYSEANGAVEKKEYLSTAFFFLVLMNCLFLFLGIIFYQPISSMLLGKSFNRLIIILMLISTALNSLFNFMQGQLLWRLKSIAYSFIAFSASLLTIIITFCFVVLLKMGVQGVFLAGVIGSLYGFSAGLLLSRKNFRIKISYFKLKQLLRFSLPLVPSNLGYYGFLYVDQIAIKHYMGLENAGIYGVACRFVIIINLMIYAIGNALPPLIYQKHGNPETKTSLERISRIFLVCVFTTICALSFLGKDIILLFTTPSYVEASILIPILALATFFSNMYLLTPGPGIAKKTHLIAGFNIAGGILNLIGNIILIPIIGLLGGAFATLISAVTIFWLYYAASQHYYRIQYQYKKIVSSFIIFLLAFMSTFVFDVKFAQTLSMNIILKLIPLTMLLAVFIFSLTTAEERRFFLSSYLQRRTTS